MKCTDNRRFTLFWILLAILLVCLTAGVVIITIHVLTTRSLAESTPEPRPESQTETPHQETGHGGAYYYAGMPVSTNYLHPFLVLTNIGYVAGYDDQRKNPAWVCYRLFVGTNHALPRTNLKFKVDPRTQAMVKQTDYRGSGYDRGHMAPNAAIAICYGTNAQLETFLMSNIIPQKPKLNQQVWERLESDVVRYARKFTQVWVIDGPIFGVQTNTFQSGVQVPGKCFKMIVMETNGQPQVLAFIIPQDVAGSEQLAQFLTNVNTVETQTGLDFFSELPKAMQEKLESEVVKVMW